MAKIAKNCTTSPCIFLININIIYTSLISKRAFIEQRESFFFVSLSLAGGLALRVFVCSLDGKGYAKYR